MKKVIDSLLDTLLVLGAFACIFTIGGGRWMTEGLDYETTGLAVPVTGSGSYSSGIEYWDLTNARNNALAPESAAPEAAAPETAEERAEREYLCPSFPLTSTADWSESYLFRSRYFEYMRDHDDMQTRALACR